MPSQRQASPRTIAAHRDTFRLLLGFAQQRTGKVPSRLEIDDLDAPLIAAFLDHLETERHNTVRTRNARRAAIRSLFDYAAVCHPEHAAVVQRVLAVPQKITDDKTIAFLHDDEIEALVAAPDRGTWEGRREHALVYLAIHTGLRVSELTGLNCADVHLGTGPHLRCDGKGRKQRAVPLPSRRNRHQRTSARQDHPRPHSTRPLPPERRPACLHRSPVIIRTTPRPPLRPRPNRRLPGGDGECVGAQPPGNWGFGLGRAL
ncbi:MAG: site-specific integrase [Actinobacteria bacterium]|nr:site-specific integrase [Actinomycetota bacterium]